MLETIPFVKARWYTPGRISPVKLIIVHSMEASEGSKTAENVAHYFATTDTKASAHFCIDNDSVIQCVKLTDTAWHCKNGNAAGIGLEHAGYAKQTEAEWLDDYGKAMLELSAKLAAELVAKFSIPIARAKFASPTNAQVVKNGFCGHRDVPLHGSHSDPGANFPWDYYLGRVAAYYAIREQPE